MTWPSESRAALREQRDQQVSEQLDLVTGHRGQRNDLIPLKTVVAGQLGHRRQVCQQLLEA